MGYKDGMHDGREAQFQDSFDIGYANGFKNGYILGTYRAINATKEQQSLQQQQPQNDLALQRVSRGQCVLCTDKSLIESDIGEIVERQARHVDKIRSVLESRYGRSTDAANKPTIAINV